ncbi:MAG: MFS transporter [Synergistaceae bacterium]|jgi:MFS family permease|nr:MFS transporter [Synergistaceae bacterium]
MRLIAYLIVTTWAIYSCSNVFFLFAAYLERSGFPSEDAGLLVGAFYGATTLARVLGGWAVERVGIRRAMAASAFLCLGAALLNLAASSFWHFLWIRLAMGCAYGVFVVALTTYQSLVIPEETRGLAFVFITLGALSCLFTVVPLADWLLTRGYDKAFLALPVGAALLCAVQAFRLPPVSAAFDAGEQSWGTWGEFYQYSPFWRIAASCIFFGLCDASIVYIPALALSMGLAPSSFVVANGLGALAMRTLARDFFNRHPRYALAGPSLLVMAVFLYLTPLSKDNLGLFACGFFYGVGMGYGFPAHLALIGDLAPARLRAKSSTLVYFCYDVSFFLLPMLMGFVAPMLGKTGAFRLLGLSCVASGVGVTVMWALFAEVPKKERKAG